MKKQIVNVNTRQFKEAVAEIFEIYCEDNRQNITWNDVKITSKGTLVSIRGKPFLRFDRHEHYLEKKYHLAAIFVFLHAIKELVIYENAAKC